MIIIVEATIMMLMLTALFWIVILLKRESRIEINILVLLSPKVISHFKLFSTNINILQHLIFEYYFTVCVILCIVLFDIKAVDIIIVNNI